MPAHLRPSAPTAPDALLCGDPARALAIAQRLLVKPRMSNHNRGLWGYHGRTRSGAELTVQATGIGGPSAAVVIGELAELGLRRAIRIGTCASLGDLPPAGTKLVIERAIAADGTSLEFGVEAGSAVEPDGELTALLRAGADLTATTVLSRDVPPSAGPPRSPVAAVAVAAVGDLQTAGVLAASRAQGIRAAAGLVVGAAAGRRLEDEPLESRLLELATLAAETFERTERIGNSLRIESL